MKRLILIGLDCAPPEFIFDRWRAELPVLDRLMSTGAYGKLESTIPPITIPAWASMFTGKDPGTLGFYGFRNRKDYSYDEMWIATSKAVKEQRVWDILTEKGLASIIIGVPQTYPVSPLKGVMVSGFLTPDTGSRYTYPEELKNEIRETVGEYILDADDFRTNDRDRLLSVIYEMTDKRFSLAEHLMNTRDWDFTALVEIGTDRIHHAFWKYMDSRHPAYVEGNVYENTILDYYRYIDRRIGELINSAPDASVMIVSDHGAKAMLGGVCVNEWLISEGYLVLKKMPDSVTPFSECRVDWERTRAWGYGGYYGRIFINVAGREPEGIVPEGQMDAVRFEIASKLAAMVDEHGKSLETKTYRPEDVYRNIKNIPPDLIVYFGNLDWRSVGSIGHGCVFTNDNDTGPDGANHDRFGIFMYNDGTGPKNKTEMEGLQIMDIAPTILNLFGIEVPPDMQGKVIGKD